MCNQWSNWIIILWFRRTFKFNVQSSTTSRWSWSKRLELRQNNKRRILRSFRTTWLPRTGRISFCMRISRWSYDCNWTQTQRWWHNSNRFSCWANAIYLPWSHCSVQYKGSAWWTRLCHCWTTSRLLWRGEFSMDVAGFAGSRFDTSSWNLLFSSCATESSTKDTIGWNSFMRSETKIFGRFITSSECFNVPAYVRNESAETEGNSSR